MGRIEWAIIVFGTWVAVEIFWRFSFGSWESSVNEMTTVLAALTISVLTCPNISPKGNAND